MDGGGEELAGRRVEGLGRDAPEGLGDPLDQLRDVRVDVHQPRAVALDHRLVGLLAGAARVLPHHLHETPEDEVGLDVEGLLAPERAVVVEGAMRRSAGGTNVSPGAVTERTKSRIAAFAGPSFQLGSVAGALHGVVAHEPRVPKQLLTVQVVPCQR